jgi:hypothetical protein
MADLLVLECFVSQSLLAFLYILRRFEGNGSGIHGVSTSVTTWYKKLVSSTKETSHRWMG